MVSRRCADTDVCGTQTNQKSTYGRVEPRAQSVGVVMMVKKYYKMRRRPYKGETWDIMVRQSDSPWRVHSSYTHSCFRDEAFKKLTGSAK